MRKSTTRLATLLVSGLTAATLMLGAAAPAQAATKPSSPTDIKRPRCEGAFNEHCHVPEAYDNIQRLTKKALATGNHVTRAGIIRLELLSLFGNVAMWGDKKKIVPTKDSLSREALNELLLDIPDASDAVVRCYGNWMKFHVASKGASNATIQNFYSVVSAIKEGRDAYGAVKGKVASEKKYIDALSRPSKALSMLRSDRMKELVNDTFGVDVDSVTSPPAPADMTDGYIRMILDSRQAVTQAQYTSSIQQLFQNIMGNGAVNAKGEKRYTGCQNIEEPPKYVTKIYTQTLRGADLLNEYSSTNSYDSEQRGDCERSGAKVVCTAYNSANPVAGEHDALRLHTTFDFPDALKKQLKPQSKVYVQMTTSWSALNGSVGWEYGYRPGDAVVGETAAGGAQAQTLGEATMPGANSFNLDYFLRENTKATIDSVKITYRYTARA